MKLDVRTARALGQALFTAAGAPAKTAEVVVDHLVTSDMRGIHSHGVARIPQYLQAMLDGSVDANAEPVLESAGGLSRVDGRGGFGQIASAMAVGHAVQASAVAGVGACWAFNQGHTGRVGAFAELGAEQGLGCLVMGSGSGLEGRWVSPFGGVDGRLSTNPIAFAVPTGRGVLCTDFATSAAAEGQIRALYASGRQASSADFLQDAAGRPTADPSVLYGLPRGAIQPLGGSSLGYKGTALGMMVEMLAGMVAGIPYDAASAQSTLVVICFRPAAGLADRVDEYIAYLKTSAPADTSHSIVLPGEPELTATLLGTGDIEISAPTWKQVRQWATRLDIEA